MLQRCAHGLVPGYNALPLLRALMLPVQMCRAKGAIVCIDSTFATPVNQRALALGADLVIHSATKWGSFHPVFCICPVEQSRAWQVPRGA